MKRDAFGWHFGDVVRFCEVNFDVWRGQFGLGLILSYRGGRMDAFHVLKAELQFLFWRLMVNVSRVRR